MRYVDLREVRGGQYLARIIHRRIATTEEGTYHHHLITGHRGCGKTTELKQIKGTLEDKNYFCVYFDVEEILDVQDLEYLDVLLAIAQVVDERLHEEGIQLSEVAWSYTPSVPMGRMRISGPSRGRSEELFGHSPRWEKGTLIS